VHRQTLNRIGAIAPVVMSLMALSMVGFQAATGRFRGGPYEGAPAHIFQLLVVLQVPFILVFLATANWGRIGQIVPPVALQAGGLALVVGSVAYLRM
jgi:hypothetical protein